MSDRYAVFGNPVGHSKSPRIHALFAAQTGQDLTYEALLAPLDGFAACVQGFISEGGRGANVTVPFKEQAFRLATQLTPRAQAAGAANTLSFRGDDIIGDNTDGAGLVRDITTHCGRAIAGKRVLLLGAGGAARGCLLPLLETGPAQLSIANRTRARADAMVREVGAGEMKWPAWGTASGIREAPLRADASPGLCKAEGGAAQGPASGLMVCCFEELTAQGSFDIVINATSAGLDDSGLAIPDSVFAAHTLAYDMLYGRETPFMMQARCAGARVADGLGMLVEQAAEAFFVWRGIHPDTASVLAALRAA